MCFRMGISFFCGKERPGQSGIVAHDLDTGDRFSDRLFTGFSQVELESKRHNRRRLLSVFPHENPSSPRSLPAERDNRLATAVDGFPNRRPFALDTKPPNQRVEREEVPIG